ncbi:MAG: biopolymer transporter ExbD [candidate division WOR-3 bacterium]
MKNRLRPVSEMTITSLADVATTLLIIFIVAGVSAALTRAGIDVNLPRTSAAKPKLGSAVIISITKNQEIYIEQKLVTLKEFNTVLNQTIAKKGTDRVFLQADASVNYGLVIEVIGKVREAGIENLGLVAEPRLPSRR